MARVFFKSHQQRGIALLEFAIVASLLVFLIAMATDFSLAIFARQELSGAARAGMEFAISNGWSKYNVVNTTNPNLNDPRIEKVVLRARNPGVLTNWRVLSNISVTSRVDCACDVSSTISQPEQNSQGKYYCPGTCSVTASDPAGSTTAYNFSTGAYVTVQADGSYTPLFPFAWPGLVSGQLPLQAKYVAKSYISAE